MKDLFVTFDGDCSFKTETMFVKTYLTFVVTNFIQNWLKFKPYYKIRKLEFQLKKITIC